MLTADYSVLSTPYFFRHSPLTTHHSLLAKVGAEDFTHSAGLALAHRVGAPDSRRGADRAEARLEVRSAERGIHGRDSSGHLLFFCGPPTPFCFGAERPSAGRISLYRQPG